MDIAFSRFCQKRMDIRSITEAEVREALGNPISSYQDNGDTIYIFHDSFERVLKVRVRNIEGETEALIIDAFRLQVTG